MTWSLLPTGTPYPFGFDTIVVDAVTPSTLYVFGGKSNFEKSTDGGATWITANIGLPGAPNQPNSGIVGLVQVGSTLILGTDGSGIYRSTDGAATWAPANTGLPNLQLTGLVKGREPAPTIYALANNGYSTTFFRSTDAAMTWVQTGTLNAPSAFNLVFTPQSPPVAYVSSGIGLFKSADGTATWTRVPPTPNLPNAEVLILLGDNGDPLRLYASSGSYELTSDDSGNTWSLLALPDGTPITPLQASTSRPGAIYGFNPINGVLVQSLDAGRDWTGLGPLTLPPPITYFVPSSLLEGQRNSGILFAAGNIGSSRLPSTNAFLQRSDDDGAHWTDVSQGLPGVPQGPALSAIAIDPTNNQNLYVAGVGGLFKTTNAGALWNAIGSGIPNGLATALVVDPGHPTTLYAAFGAYPPTGTLGMGVYASSDGGLTWSARNTGLTDLTITALALDRNDPQSLYAGTDTQGVFRTTDGGMHWAAFSNGLPAGDGMMVLSLEVDPVDGRNIFVGTADGAFALTLDASTHFLPVIEYYAQSLDHYFMATEAQADIAALDSGAIPGWIRTGQTFRALPGPVVGASPVCRFYIPPAYGDSHFFSASVDECTQVQAKYPFFDYETPSAFDVYLADAATGNCPQGSIPVYRVWDNRVDTNHRYTTDPTIRAQMIARGWIAEGYGVGVGFCALQ